MTAQGRQLLSQKKYLQASKSFSKAVMAFQYLLKDQQLTREEIVIIMKESILPSYSNLALCHLKLQSYESVLVFANQVLVQNNSHVKALYRRALAYKGLKQYEEAICDFKSLQRLSPEHKEMAQLQIAECRGLIRVQKQNEKIFAKKLLESYNYQGSSGQRVGNNKNQAQEGINWMWRCVVDTCKKLAFWR